MASAQRDEAIQKFGQLVGAYRTLTQEHTQLKANIERVVNEINEKLNIDTLATTLANKLTPILQGSADGTGGLINYTKVREACIEAMNQTQDFLPDITTIVNGLIPPTVTPLV